MFYTLIIMANKISSEEKRMSEVNCTISTTELIPHMIQTQVKPRKTERHPEG